MPSAFQLHRASNRSWSGGGHTVGNESIGGNPYQALLDFSMLGPQFWIVFCGGLASSGVGSQTWRVRVGGTRDTVDGAIALVQVAAPVPAFGLFSVKQLIDNAWSGVQLVKLTGDAGVATPFAINPVLFFSPPSL